MIKVEKNMKERKPPTGKYTLNAHVAVFPNERVGFGYVLRDDQGKVRLTRKMESTADEKHHNSRRPGS